MKSSAKLGAVAAALVLVGALLIAAFSLGLLGGGSSSTTAAPDEVNVFGLVSTLGQGTHMVAVVFTDAVNGRVSNATVSEGRFSVDLPNPGVYNVSCAWVGNYTWQRGVSARGQLTLDVPSGAMPAQSYNFQQETPNTVVAVHGVVSWLIPLAIPTSISFSAADGATFEVPVANGSFSGIVPNLMEYQVRVFWQLADGASDYYFARNLAVNAGLGVVGLDVKIGP